MGYKKHNDLLAEHIAFLDSHGLNVDELKIDSGFIRCCSIGNTGRGELCYKTTSTSMDNGLIGLATWCRGVNGTGNFQSYGCASVDRENQPIITKPKANEYTFSSEKHDEAAKKAFGFWNNSQLSGTSDYLDRKGVGYYGIRFRNNEYGRVAVVPMYDDQGKLWSYQLLNPDGTKRHPKEARTDGLFHCLSAFVNGKPIGIAESYVTAATCQELTGIPTACAFSCHNLSLVAKTLGSKYPDSPIVLFADNDRHLESRGLQNQGVIKAQQACNSLGDRVIVAIPDFGDSDPSKDASDWNDLVRIKGKEHARIQISDSIKS